VILSIPQAETIHQQIIRELSEQFQPIFEHSPHGVYLYLDDIHKVCNEQMARMFGLTAREWAEMPMFLPVFVAEKDQETFARNYQHNILGLSHPVTFRFQGRRKDGSTFLAETDMIPLCWRGYPIAYHFVREISVG
jgi:PAS domain S-box-containing protein